MENLKHKLPKKYASMVRSVEREDGLIDDCKYMVYLEDGYEFSNDGQSFPAMSIKEICEMMKSVDKTETNQTTTPKETSNFYEGTLRSRAVEFLYVNNRNYKDESEIKKHIEGFRRIDQSKTK
jgi:hypothetical protein